MPRWRGEDLRGQTILLAAEQGLGDAIQFARYAAPLAERGANVIVECLAGLERLIATAPGVARIAKWGDGSCRRVAGHSASQRAAYPRNDAREPAGRHALSRRARRHAGA